MGNKSLIVGVLIAVYAMSVVAADPPSKFRWDDVDGHGKSYIMPIKTQKGSEDQSYAYAPMDYLETMSLILAGKSANELTEAESNRYMFAQSNIDAYAANAKEKAGAFTHNHVYQYDNTVPCITKSLDWMLRYGLNGRRLMHLIMVEALDPTQTIGSDSWRVGIRTIKRNILDCPLLVGYQHVDKYFKNGKYCYFPEYPITSYLGVNYYRTAMIIGYDDSIPASMFESEGQTPAGDGAWIAKGSYGESFGDDGYFYISYYDDRIFRYEAPLNYYFSEYTCLLLPDLDHKYGDIYCHRAESPTSVVMDDLDSCAVVFTAERDSVISAVGIMGAVAKASHKVYAFVNCSIDNPATGTCVIDRGEINHPHYDAGYYTLDLPTPFAVRKGQRFSIIVDCARGVGVMTNPNPKRGRCFRSHWNINGITAMEWTDMANREKDNEWFITAYTQTNGTPEIELLATDGTEEEAINVSWTPIDNARYNLYRSEEGGAFHPVKDAQGLSTPSYRDVFDEKKSDSIKLGKRKYRYYVETTVNDEKVRSNTDEGYTVEKQEIPTEWMSGFQPPEPSDILFVFKEGENINTTLRKGEATITLDIPRYFGDKDKLLQSKALAKEARLTIAVCDVDSKYHYKPEKDLVFLVGSGKQDEIELGRLDGANKEVLECPFTINTQDLNLRKSPNDVDGGKNTIKIKVDEKDGGWVTRIAWISLEIPAAPPVVLSHGIRSNADTLNRIKEEIEKLGLPVRTFGYTNKGNDGIQVGAAQLWSEIIEFRNECKVDMVNIVAHSMGGLKAREYVEKIRDSKTGKTDVWHLIQIATPNGGSPLADKVAGLLVDGKSPEQSVWNWANDLSSLFFDMGPNDRALFELTTKYMSVYNVEHSLNSDVEYGVVAGDVSMSFLERVTHAFDYACYQIVKNAAGANDLIVPVSSAHAVRMKNMWRMPGPRTQYSHSALVEESARTVITLFKNELVETKSRAFEASSGRVAAKSSSRAMVANTRLKLAGKNDEYNSFSKMGVATVGEELTLPFYVVEGRNVDMALFLLNSKTFSMRMISPSGREYVDTGDDTVEIFKGDGLACCCMTNVECGVWQLAFTPLGLVNDSNVSCPYVLIANEADVDFLINASLDAESVKSGGAFTARVAPRLNDTSVKGNVTINVGNPDGSAVSVVAQDNGLAPDLEAGDGIYSAVIPAPEAGNYLMSVRIDADIPVAFSRTTLIGGVAYASDSQLDSEISAVGEDLDGDGLNDMLLVNFPVQVTSDGEYRILATLSDLNGREVSTAWTSNIVCAVGTNVFSVAFDGRDIYGAGECDGYVVSSVKLFEVGEDYEAVVDERQNFFTTTDCNFKQFEHNLVEMGDGGSEEAVDEDGDGIYDRLDIAFPLRVDELIAGEYKWSASLEDDSGRRLETAFGEVAFTAGTEDVAIPMSFDGKGISENMTTNGQFRVANVVIWGNGRTFRLGDKFTTQSYELSQWVAASVRFMTGELLVNEGETATIRVMGGSAECASSVKAYLTYITASAADVDLGKMKFPLTLSWEVGEVGEKVIAIPIKKDTAVEYDEFFTLQLADAQGMKLGEDHTCRITIHDPGSDGLQPAKSPYVCVLADPANAGKVTGNGLYAAGKKVTLKATANKGYVFAGWYETGNREEGIGNSIADGLLSQAASLSFEMPPNDVEYVAMFVTTAEDAASLAIAVEDMETEADGTIGTIGTDGTRAFDLGACVTSLSLPKLAVSGLPSGLKFDAKTNKITGKATKPGVYSVTVKATNASVTKATDATTATFKLTVRNFTCAALPGLFAATDAYGTVNVGVAFGADRIDCSLEKDWSVKVTGLPAGLKYDAKTNTISGVPTAKPGAYTVTFTASKKGEKSQIATITLNVAALPDWAVGTFTGYVHSGDYGLATMTVAANGKISGKVSLGGTNWTFKADSYVDIECLPSADGDGVETNYAIRAIAAAGKEKRTLALRVANRQTASSAGDDEQGATLPPEMINAKVTGDSEDGEQTFSLWRMIWKDKATAGVAKATLAEWEGTYNVSFEPSENSGYGSGYLALAVGKDGNVKATGKLADGTVLSATSPLLYDGEYGYFTLVYAAPSAYMGGSFALSISFDEAKGVLGNRVEVSRWSSRNPQATGQYGTGFARYVSFFGSYYDKNALLTNFYDRLTFTLAELPPLASSCKRTYFDENGRKVTETQQGEAAPVYLLDQDGLTVSINAKGTGFDVLKATKPEQDKVTKLWTYEGANDGGLTLTFDPKTGVFKGSYTFWYDYLSVSDETTGKETWTHSSKKVTFEGLMVQGETLRGFYLREESVPYADPKTGKQNAYKYKSSHAIRFLSPDSDWRRIGRDGEWRYSVPVNWGEAHTFWLDGISADTGVMGIYVERTFTYLEAGEEREGYVGASENGGMVDKDGNLVGLYVILTADDWPMIENRPKSLSLRVIVDGDYDEANVDNRKFKFHHLCGKGVFP